MCSRQSHPIFSLTVLILRGSETEGSDLKLYQGESELINRELPIIRAEQADKPAALPARRCAAVPCQSRALSLGPEWKRGSYRFKHFHSASFPP